MRYFENISRIFYGADAAFGQQMKYVNWLSTLLRGLNGLELYNPELKKWNQVRRQ